MACFEFWKFLNILQRYRHEQSGTFFPEYCVERLLLSTSARAPLRSFVSPYIRPVSQTTRTPPRCSIAPIQDGFDSCLVSTAVIYHRVRQRPAPSVSCRWCMMGRGMATSWLGDQLRLFGDVMWIESLCRLLFLKAELNLYTVDNLLFTNNW